MDTTEPLDLDAADSLVAETDKHRGNVHNCSILKDRHDDLIERLGTALAVTIAEVRRLRELQEDTAAENARLSAWWHAMRRGGLA